MRWVRLRRRKARTPKRRSSIAMRCRRILRCLPRVTISALLLAGLKGRQNEAIDAWKQNLAAKPDYPRFAPEPGRTAGPHGRYGRRHRAVLYVVEAKPEYVAARMALGGLYLKSSQPDCGGGTTARRGETRIPRTRRSWNRSATRKSAANHADEAQRSVCSRPQTTDRERRSKAHPRQNGVLNGPGNARVRSIKFWGVRGSTPDAADRRIFKFGGNTPCVEIRRPTNERIIFDAGSGIRALGRSMVQRSRRRAHRRHDFSDAFPLGPYSGHSVFRAHLRPEKSHDVFFRRHGPAPAGNAGRPDVEALLSRSISARWPRTAISTALKGAEVRTKGAITSGRFR